MGSWRCVKQGKSMHVIKRREGELVSDGGHACAASIVCGKYIGHVTSGEWSAIAEVTEIGSLFLQIRRLVDCIAQTKSHVL